MLVNWFEAKEGKNENVSSSFRGKPILTFSSFRLLLLLYILSIFYHTLPKLD
jgi:hypothetical protein